MTRRVIQCIVAVTAPDDLGLRAALAEVRAALRNSDPGELALFTVSPIPRDRLVKRRRPPTKNETPPLLAYMGAK